MDKDQQNQVHLLKLKLMNKNIQRLHLACPYIAKLTTNLEMNNKTPLYVPLITNILVSKDFISNSKSQQIPINLQPLLGFPFDKHHIKVQTYEDEERQIKGEVIHLELQFTSHIMLKNQINYVTVNFKQANLKKDLKIFGKMSPYIVVHVNEQKLQTRQVKDGHLNPRFQEAISIPFTSLFDKITIEIKQGDQRIGYNDPYVFQLFGKNQEKQLELKGDRKIVGTLVYTVQQFQPLDF